MKKERRCIYGSLFRIHGQTATLNNPPSWQVFLSFTTHHIVSFLLPYQETHCFLRQACHSEKDGCFARLHSSDKLFTVPHG